MINNIPPAGYTKLEYGSNFENPLIIQHNYNFSFGKEIAFYNRTEKEVCYHNTSLIAVWRIKERKQK